MKTLTEATRMLDTWKEAYATVRREIEESGRDARWEFDRRKLFEQSDYMASICRNLLEVAEVSSGGGL